MVIIPVYAYIKNKWGGILILLTSQIIFFKLFFLYPMYYTMYNTAHAASRL